METFDNDSGRTIRYNGNRMLRLFGIVAVMIAISVVIHPEQWLQLSVSTIWVFSALGVLLALNFVVFPRTFYLRLTSDGLLVHRPLSEHFYRWCEVYDFRIVDGPRNTGIRIVWNLTDDSPHRTAVVATARAILGHDVSLLNTFELPADELVDLLNAWQQKYGGVPPEIDSGTALLNE